MTLFFFEVLNVFITLRGANEKYDYINLISFVSEKPS